MLGYWDKNLICRFANAAYRDWFGKTREEMVGKITIMELLGPLYEKNKPFIDGALAGEKQTFQREITLPGGEVRYSFANYVPDIESGEVKGFFVHVADITSIELLKIQLEQTNQIVIEQNQRLLNFANIVSHNLKSYANNLEGILRMHRAAVSVETREQALVYLDRISAGFKSTVDHLNEIVKIQNDGALTSESICLRDYAETAIETLRIQIESSSAELYNKIDKSIILIANPAYIESILLNLLTNAIKYRDPGRRPVIELAGHTEGNEVILQIRDNGLGINLEKNREKLFGMYKTFHGNKDAQGIGLFITKYQVEAMGGRIEVESEVDKGTVFTVYLRKE